MFDFYTNFLEQLAKNWTTPLHTDLGFTFDAVIPFDHFYFIYKG